MELQQDQREWADLAELDPMWAILSSPGRRDGGWPGEEFDATGRVEIAGVLQRAAALGLPLRRRAALDFARLQPRPRLYSVLRRLGVPATFLYRRLRLQPIRMRWIGSEAVTAHLAGCGLEVLDCETERVNTIDSTTYYVTRPPICRPAAPA